MHYGVIIVNRAKIVVDYNKKLHFIKKKKLTKIMFKWYLHEILQFFCYLMKLKCSKFETIALWCDNLLAHIEYIQKVVNCA
jgi:hypothetical protein